jgi:hypothetical protein
MAETNCVKGWRESDGMDGPRVGIDLCQRGSCLILWKRRPSMEQISAIAIGLDIAKQYFQVHGADNVGNPVLRRKLRRNQVLKFFTEFSKMSGWH